MSYRQIHELAAEGFPVAVICRYLRVSRSGYYDWLARTPSAREVADKKLTTTITAIHTMSRYSYGAPRVHAELRLRLGVRCGRKRVARLMRTAGIAGICHGRKRLGGKPLPACHDDLVGRRFVAERPNALWVTDITEHPTRDGTVYCCAVLDVYSRMIVGWSIADHRRTDLVVDALQMACWRRRPMPGTICHSDRGSQGGFNWSTQHLDFVEVCDGVWEAAVGGSWLSGSDSLAGTADGGLAAGPGAVLGGDCCWGDDRGRRYRGGRVVAGGVPLVPSRWRCESRFARGCFGSLPVVE
jgi:hypothetical protein